MASHIFVSDELEVLKTAAFPGADLCLGTVLRASVLQVVCIPSWYRTGHGFLEWPRTDEAMGLSANRSRFADELSRCRKLIDA